MSPMGMVPDPAVRSGRQFAKGVKAKTESS